MSAELEAWVQDQVLPGVESEGSAGAALRRMAWTRFKSLQWPSVRQPAWKYAPFLKSVSSGQFRLAEEPAVELASAERIAAARALLQGWALPLQRDGARVVASYNGQFLSLSGQSDPFEACHGSSGVSLEAGDLSTWMEQAPQQWASFWQAHLDKTQNPLRALNYSFAQGGFYLKIPDNQDLAAPLHLLYGVDFGVMVHPRNYIELGKNSQLTLIEHYIGEGDRPYFQNAQTLIRCGAGSQLRHCVRQQGSTAGGVQVYAAEVHQGKGSAFTTQLLSLGGSSNRQSLRVELAEPEAACQIQALIVGQAREGHDVGVRVCHDAPRTRSRVVARGILGGQSRGALTGQVEVSQEAPQTVSHLEMRQLQVSPAAEANCRPELEIYHRDVQCTHGATTGQLDPLALFYLQSRGLSVPVAKRLLVASFIQAQLQGIPDSGLQAEVEASIWRTYVVD